MMTKQVFSISRVFLNYAQRAGLCAGVELAFRPPGTAAWLFDKVK